MGLKGGAGVLSFSGAAAASFGYVWQGVAAARRECVNQQKPGVLAAVCWAERREQIGWGGVPVRVWAGYTGVVRCCGQCDRILHHCESCLSFWCDVIVSVTTPHSLLLFLVSGSKVVHESTLS